MAHATRVVIVVTSLVVVVIVTANTTVVVVVLVVVALVVLVLVVVAFVVHTSTVTLSLRRSVASLLPFTQFVKFIKNRRSLLWQLINYQQNTCTYTYTHTHKILTHT